MDAGKKRELRKEKYDKREVGVRGVAMMSKSENKTYTRTRA